MSISQQTVGQNTTITLTYTAQTAKVSQTLSDAAKFLYSNGYEAGVSVSDPDDLTNAQIGTIIDGYVKKNLINLAAEWHIRSSEETAKTTALSEIDSRYL